MRKLVMMMMAILIAIAAGACGAVDDASESASEPQPSVSQEEESEIEMTKTVFDKTYVARDGVDVIYLAGGCFWGIEQLMQSVPGVVSATSGYANGIAGDEPTYNTVILGDTGYRETVRVEYETDKVSLDTILFAYFNVIDPSLENQQGNDRGTQYQTGVYYTDEKSKETVERIADIERRRHDKFVVEIKPIERFYDAEEYHQDYLEKNPSGYCHIPKEEMSLVSQIVVDAADYRRPSDAHIKETLSGLQYKVTQEAGTEPPFENAYYDHHERGIYVDIVTGEPLFSSSDKFDSGTGWPSFTKGIDDNTFVFISDASLGMMRTEVRSRVGDSHLGHVFYGESGVPEGVRYCINSAALRFVPYDEMETEGYGYLMENVE